MDDLPIIELRTRISADKEGDNTNYQIRGLSIHAEVHGTAEPALTFLHYWGKTSRTWRKVTAELEGQFKTVAYDARGWGKVLSSFRPAARILWASSFRMNSGTAGGRIWDSTQRLSFCVH